MINDTSLEEGIGIMDGDASMQMIDVCGMMPSTLLNEMNE